MRGAGALAVVFAHALIAAPYLTIGGAWFAQLVQLIFWISATALPMFFVVSGFCIHLAQIRHEGIVRFRFAAFWRRRMWRLYPTYFVAVCCSIGLLLLLWGAGRGAELLVRYPEPRGAWLAADFGMHVLMLHGLHPVFDHGAANPPLWSLAREEYLYLMYPLLLLLRRRLPWYTLAGLLAALSIAIQLMAPRVTSTPAWEWLLVMSAPALWIQWHLGVVAADAYRGVIRLPVFWRQVRWVPGWLLLGYLIPPGIVFIGLAYFTVVNAWVSSRVGRSLAGEPRDRRDHSRWHWVVLVVPDPSSCADRRACDDTPRVPNRWPRRVPRPRRAVDDRRLCSWSSALRDGGAAFPLPSSAVGPPRAGSSGNG